MTRHAGSANPCPVIDFDAGFNAWMAHAYELPKGVTVEKKFGKPFGESYRPARYQGSRLRSGSLLQRHL